MCRYFHYVKFESQNLLDYDWLPRLDLAENFHVDSVLRLIPSNIFVTSGVLNVHPGLFSCLASLILSPAVDLTITVPIPIAKAVHWSALPSRGPKVYANNYPGYRSMPEESGFKALFLLQAVFINTVIAITRVVVVELSRIEVIYGSNATKLSVTKEDRLVPIAGLMPLCRYRHESGSDLRGRKQVH